MAKRYFDSKSFSCKHMRGLQGAYKLLWIYIKHTCDHAGVWEVELDVTALRCGFEYDETECLKIFGDAIVPTSDGQRWWIPEFIEEQYGWELNPANKVHNSALEILNKYNLLQKFFEIKEKNKPLESPLQGAVNGAIDKAIDKDKAKEQIGGAGERENPEPLTDEPVPSIHPNPNNPPLVVTAEMVYQPDRVRLVQGWRLDASSMLCLADCLDAFLLNTYCGPARMLMCHNRHFDVMDEHKRTAEFQRLKGWGEVFNQVLTKRMLAKRSLGEWAAHFANWIAKENMNIQPEKYFDNAADTTTGKTGADRAGSGKQGAGIAELIALKHKP